jgi:cobalt/nickel transport system permease protein
MEHSFLDRYSHLESIIHNLDARTKLLIFLTLIVVTVLTPPQCWPVFLLHLILIGLTLRLSRIPVRYVLTRSLIILPFVLMVALFIPFLPAHRPAGGYSLGLGSLSLERSHWLVFWNLLIKGFIGVLAIILLSSTTPFPRLLEALKKFKVPSLLTLLLGFIYRYFFVLLDEILTVKRAVDSRGYKGRSIFQVRTLGRLLGQLFLRTYERGERVYLGMVSRGFQGLHRTLNPSEMGRADYVFLAIFLSITAFSQMLFR